VIGLLGTHGCGEVAELAEGLEIIPRVRNPKNTRTFRTFLQEGYRAMKVFFDLEVPNESGLSNLS
jgi:hypothetical protein